MADWSGLCAVLTVKYINMKKQDKEKKAYNEAWKAGYERAAKEWNERNNCVSVEEADEIWDYVKDHKEEVRQLLIEDLDPEDKRYDSKVRFIQQNGCISSLCDDYCMLKYGKMCYPRLSEKRRKYYTDYVNNMSRIYASAAVNKNKKKGLFSW